MSRPPLPSRRTALGATALLAFALTSTTVAGIAGADAATAPHGGTPLTAPQAYAKSAPAVATPTTKARVTLVTGDRVTVTTLPNGKTATAIQPAPGNTEPIQATTIGDHTFVFPQSALPYLAAHLVDENLFDVTGLIAQGYDDAHQRALPLIAQYAKGVAPSTPTGAEQQDVLTSIHGASLAAPRRQATSFWASVTAGTQAEPRLADGMTKLWLDGRVQADLVDSTTQVGAPTAWADGYNGTGTTVAVLDTGIDATHPDLASQIATSQSFVPDEDIADHFGHGTHVASTIAGTGAASGGSEKGVAWGAHLAVGKVLGDDGFGQDSWIIAGMEWAADHAPVVNMSLGTQEISDGTDPISQAADDLSESKGTLFVVSAGNQGCDTCMGAPAAAQDALTVGSVDSNDALSWFSSTGPRSGDAGMKPDLVAPGENILAARSSLSSDGEGSYISMSGTSMAAPHVAGAAAILAQRHPGWSGAQIKDALVSAAHGLDAYTPYQVGTGRLDIPAALGDVHATGSVSFGFHPWPHDADTAVTHTVTFRNDGSDPVTLDLAADVRDGSGSPAPDGAITLSADQVVVPAGGSASVDVTGDPTAVPAGTRLSGTLVASDSGTPVTRTSLGMDVEAERYNLTLNVTDRDGQPAPLTYVMVHEQNDWDPLFVPVDGTATVRMPPGRYSVTAFMDVADGDGRSVALVGDPEVVLSSSDATVDLDAHAANPVTVTSPRAGAVATWRQMEWHVSAGNGMSDMATLPDTYAHMYAQATDPVTSGSYTFVSRWRLRRDYISVRVGTHTVDSLMAIDSGWVNRAADTTLAYAGAGTAAEFDAAHVSGKIAVVALDSDTTDVSSYAALAAGRGARALLVVNHQPGAFLPAAGPQYGVKAGLPVAGVSGNEGAWLVPQAQAHAAASLDGGVNTPYVYDLLHEYQGHIPTSLHYAPKQSDLARIDNRFIGAQHVLGGEFRWGYPSYSQTAFGLMQYAAFPSTRVDYVSTEPGTRWYEGAITLDPRGWDQRGVVRGFRPGSHTREEWFGPVINPRIGSGYWGPERQTDWLELNLPSYGDSWNGHTGSRDNGATPSQVIKLYRGGHWVKTSKGWQSMGVQVPEKRQKFRATNDVRDAKTLWSTATSSHTSWTFWSHTADPDKPPAKLPFVSLAYHVATDLHGRLPAGHRVAIHVSGYQAPHAVDAGRISGGWLKVSYNRGRTWTKVALHGSAGHWTGHLTLPANASRVVSLRGSAWDTHGNSVTQSVIGAIELR